MTSFISFPSIEGFHNVKKLVDKYPYFVDGPMFYRSKIKLHGTNAAVRITRHGKVFAQSRTATISVGNDNAGFASWLESRHEYFEKIASEFTNITIFGEWCGRGIQAGTAIQKIDKKIFAVFTIHIENEMDEDNSLVISEPSEIAKYLLDHPSDIHILPWYDSIEIDWLDRPKLIENAEYLSTVIDKIEQCDPWVKDTFDIEGICEGLVYYPIKDKLIRRDFSNFVFKAKGEKHKTVAQKQKVQVDPEVAKSVDEFVVKVLTDARLEQGVREISGGELTFNQNLIGPFMGWISKDVHKETQDELDVSGLSWPDVSKQISQFARAWYLKNLNNL